MSDPRPDTEQDIANLHARNVRIVGHLAMTVAVLIGLVLVAAIAFGVWFAIRFNT